MTLLNHAGCSTKDEDPFKEGGIAAQLKNHGKTYGEIGIILGMTPSRVRYQFYRNHRLRMLRQPHWTDGLSRKLAYSLRWLEFKDKEEVYAAFINGHIATLANVERGICADSLTELARWLNIEHCDASPCPSRKY